MADSKDSSDSASYTNDHGERFAIKQNYVGSDGIRTTEEVDPSTGLQTTTYLDRNGKATITQKDLNDSSHNSEQLKVDNIKNPTKLEYITNYGFDRKETVDVSDKKNKDGTEDITIAGNTVKTGRDADNKTITIHIEKDHHAILTYKGTELEGRNVHAVDGATDNQSEINTVVDKIHALMKDHKIGDIESAARDVLGMAPDAAIDKKPSVVGPRK